MDSSNETRENVQYAPPPAPLTAVLPVKITPPSVVMADPATDSPPAAISTQYDRNGKEIETKSGGGYYADGRACYRVDFHITQEDGGNEDENERNKLFPCLILSDTTPPPRVAQEPHCVLSLQ